MTADRSRFPAQLDLRVDPADVALLGRVASALGFRLPLEANTVAGDPDGVHALWLGPDEWLAVGAAGAEGALEARLRDALGEAFGTVVDVSANRLAMSLAGPDAREILEGGCPIDLQPPAFGPGRCAQTLLARANVLLHQVSDEPGYRLYVRPSFAGYVEAWLADARAGMFAS